MISRTELRALAQARLQDATELLKLKRYDGAIYVCGYAIELALKARICRTLKWLGYPQTNSEFNGLLSFRTHDFDILLRLSGLAQKIRSTYMADWSIVANWRPDYRYRPMGSAKKGETEDMINATTNLLKVLL
jgi:HEPN domain-containing protein